jgi:hypothetical protein
MEQAPANALVRQKGNVTPSGLELKENQNPKGVTLFTRMMCKGTGKPWAVVKIQMKTSSVIME